MLFFVLKNNFDAQELKRKIYAKYFSSGQNLSNPRICYLLA